MKGCRTAGGGGRCQGRLLLTYLYFSHRLKHYRTNDNHIDCTFVELFTHNPRDCLASPLQPGLGAHVVPCRLADGNFCFLGREIQVVRGTYVPSLSRYAACLWFFMLSLPNPDLLRSFMIRNPPYPLGSSICYFLHRKKHIIVAII